jgi:adenylosuccinate lyase
MDKLGLKTPTISTQLPPPEGLQRYLNELGELIGLLNDLATDIRILYIPEIGEVSVASMAFNPDQHTGSSTMSHKRNPTDCENTGGMFEVIIAQIGMLPSLSVSWLQRDLTGSVVLRFLTAVPVLSFHALKTMSAVITRLDLNRQQLQANLDKQGDIILSELYQLALRRYGYAGNAHQLTSQAVEGAKLSGYSLWDEFEHFALGNDAGLTAAWERVKQDEKLSHFLKHPQTYIGDAATKAKRVALRFTDLLDLEKTTPKNKASG